jgi:hypothetical protein
MNAMCRTQLHDESSRPLTMLTTPWLEDLNPFVMLLMSQEHLDASKLGRS